MPLDRDEILLGNIHESLKLFQLAVTWAMTAAVAFFLLSLQLSDRNAPAVPVPGGQLTAQVAWLVAYALFVVLGGFALSALRRAEINFHKLAPTGEVREAILLYPSLATNQNDFFRLGPIFFCAAAFLVAMVIELRREWAGRNWWEQEWMGISLMILVMLLPYLFLMYRLWGGFASRPSQH